MIILLFVGVSCAKPAPTPTPAPAPTAEAPFPNPYRQPIIDMITVSNRKIYSLGEPVIFTVSIKNLQAMPVVLIPNPPMIDIEIVLPSKLPRPGQKADSEIVETLAPGTGQVVLEPAGKVTYTLVWDQRDSHGEQVPPGYYFPNIKINTDRGVLKVNGKRPSTSGNAFGILIRPPPEPGEKVIEMSQSRTAEGFTFTLERIELTSVGTRVYFYLTGGGVLLAKAEAEYNIDAGPFKKAGLSKIPYYDAFYIWDNLDPVPSDAKELTFVITPYGERVSFRVEGPWEFKVPLESKIKRAK